MEARLQRQAALTKKTPLQLWVIMDEAVLTRMVSSETSFRVKLTRLIDAGRQPYITLHVIPFEIGAHPGMTGPFVTMAFPDEADSELMYTESMGGDLNQVG